MLETVVCQHGPCPTWAAVIRFLGKVGVVSALRSHETWTNKTGTVGRKQLSPEGKRSQSIPSPGRSRPLFYVNTERRNYSQIFQFPVVGEDERTVQTKGPERKAGRKCRLRGWVPATVGGTSGGLGGAVQTWCRQEKRWDNWSDRLPVQGKLCCLLASC